MGRHFYWIEACNKIYCLIYLREDPKLTNVKKNPLNEKYEKNYGLYYPKTLKKSGMLPSKQGNTDNC